MIFLSFYYYFHNIDVTIILKFAQFEFKYGDIERGRTMFESLLSSYPRRVDLWCVYLDMMIQTNDITTVRLVQMNYYYTIHVQYLTLLSLHTMMEPILLISQLYF